ncbi:glycosyltransferase [Siansivirga zeaxanthinifaciens]|uniref:Glycosyl transferase family 1 domain-containing protein n=1 Tax=Siansivirga zeaxanthinifaciens CC-SAMT-1 TaxID=1454006 RepID=A0A0C5WHR9_9FLAO|nr:glycosyltransferase [Siansivirga zeaxanthinifaciens]AJR04704.1 hypothetical protein AW14_00780 [Siansivirga zeaxanthinifaciens CC-SAMT-1]
MSKKVCIISDSLSFGGAEKVAANMSISLSKKGYEIHIVSMTDFIDYQFEGALYNFGLVKKSNNKLLSLLKFKKYFSLNKFDVIIDHRVRNKYLKEIVFSKFIFKNETIIYCVHNYDLSYYFSFLKFPWASLFPHVKNRMFVSVCNEIKNKLENKLFLKSTVVYNYTIPNKYSSDKKVYDYDYIIGVGRLTKIKQFDKLIKNFSKSHLPNSNVKLVILGSGSEKLNLELLISELSMGKHVELIPFTKNPNELISNAKALVLTSKIEGFPMVLVESLFLNTPVIAFNCKSGPSEIIQNYINGLLVDNQNEQQLTLALNKLLDNHFYNNLEQNTHKDLDRFSEDVVTNKWIDILENQHKFF